MSTDGQWTWNLNQCFEHKGELGELSDDVTDSDDESDLKQSKEVNTLSWLKTFVTMKLN
jgi:hypothetical protein